MTTQPSTPLPIQIRTPAAQSLELLTRIAAGIETQNALLEYLNGGIRHLIEISDANAQSSADAAELLTKFADAWSRPQAATLTASPDAPAGATSVFMAEKVTLGYDDNGRPIYKVFGGRYQKFGVRCWPEALPLLGIDASTLKPGPNAFSRAVVALMGEKGPQKVVGLAV